VLDPNFGDRLHSVPANFPTTYAARVGVAQAF
jgi:hypothetical protein